MKIEFERAECAILGMILDVFWSIQAAFVVGELLFDVPCVPFVFRVVLFVPFVLFVVRFHYVKKLERTLART